MADTKTPETAVTKRPARTPLYTAARVLAAVLFRTLCPVKYYHAERAGLDAPFIVISNHLSGLDPIVVGKPIKRYEVTFLGKKELVGNRFTHWLLTSLHMIIVDRHNSDMEAMRACMKAVREGEVLGIFPEGTRHHEGVMEHTEAGVGLIALRSGVPLLPMYIDCRARPFHRTRVWVGEVIPTEDLRAEGVNRQTAEQLMERIKEAYGRMQAELAEAIHH